MFVSPTSMYRYFKPFLLLCLLILILQITVLSADEIETQSHVNLKVSNITFKELLKLEESLKQRMAALEKFERKNFDAGIGEAEIKLTISDDLQTFTTDLALTEFAAFELEILNQTSEQIELRVNQRTGNRAVQDGKSDRPVKKPKVMILISERHWQSSSPAIETAVIKKFTDEGYKVIDPNQIRNAHPSEPPAGLLHGDPTAASTIGRQYGAELVIVGEAFTNDTTRSYGLYTSRTTSEIKILDVDTSTIFTAHSETGKGADLTQDMAIQKAFQDTGYLLADNLMKQIAEKWNRNNVKEYNVSLVVGELTFTQLVQLEQLLQNWRGIDAINLRNFEAGVAVIGVDTQHSAQHLAAQLVTKPLNQLSLDVKNFNTMQIDIDVRRAVALYDIQLVIANITFEELIQLEQALKKWSGVTTVFLRSFDAGIAAIELHYKGGAQRLAGELLRKNFNKFSLDIINFSDKRIDLEVKKQQTVQPRPIKLTISQLSFEQLGQLEQTLKQWDGIKSVSLQGFDDGNAVFDIHSEQDAQHLANELERKPLNDFALDVISFTPDQINIIVIRATSVNDVQLIISPLPFNQLVRFQQVLKEWAGVDTVYLRSFDTGVAIIELHTENGTQQLAEELASRPLKEFVLDITNFSPDRINISLENDTE